MGIYLDYNASAPIDDRVLSAMMEAYRNSYGNADSRTHSFGENARKTVENARTQVASLLGVDKSEVFFTSGSTESNNIAILGLQEFAEKSNKKHIITTAIEHKSVLETAKSLEKQGYRIDILESDESGRICVEQVKELVSEDTLLVSIMHANNETGIIQPVKEIGEFLKEQKVLFHVDATQSCGKLVEEIRELSYDMLSLSAHKFNGPQGIGALILRKKRYKLPPVKAIIYGGQQESGIRPGTIPVGLVAGLGVACELAEVDYKNNKDHCRECKTIVIEQLEQSGLEYTINGNQEFCMENTVNVSIKGVEAEALMLSSKQYCGISNGSACNSKSYSPSYVLVAMGLEENRISSSVRLSWGAGTDQDELKSNIAELLNVAKGLVF